MWEIIIAIGAILVGAGIIFGHYWPNRYWLALIIVGILVLVVGIILLIQASFFILPFI